ncbi:MULTISPECIES: YggL family protein [unclassified Paludibacterium]|uniref:YggL family protein n=1 Tax=unclassified Paludibacterium TaxID=2618429 RepID=UPI001C04E01A|nr:YggL family protein [Paludibacterium sp. B53371]BEV72259.1 YggL family protein [Paludibacterium sp. THUN1379]
MRTARNPALASHVKRMSPRLRKKLRVGEFRELGFSLKASIDAGLEVAAQDALLDAWLGEVDRHGVSFGGQFDARGAMEGVVFPVAGNLVTEAIRTGLLDWLKARPEVKDLQASGLFDIWHEA